MLWINRKRFEKVGEAMGVIFAKLPLRPNHWTLLSLGLSAVVFYLLATRSFLAAFLLFSFTMALDMIDGAVARKTRSVTKFGGYLDSVTDRLIEFAVILGLLFAGYPSTWLFILMAGSFMSTYARAASFEKGIKKNIIGGLLEHTDRLIFFAAIMLVSAFSTLYALYLIELMAVLCVVSFLQRFLKSVKR